jgi:outer membrane protein TolC
LFYRGQGEVAQSNARLEFLRLTLQSEQTMVSAEAAAAYFDYTAKVNQADRYSKSIVPQSTKLEQMAEDSYTSGKSNLLTLIDAQRKLNDVRKAYIDSLFAAQSAFAALEEVVGAPLD